MGVTVSDTKILKAAMIGLRNHAGTLDPDRGHGLIKSFRAQPEVQAVAYCEWAPEQAQALAAIARADPQVGAYTSLDDLLAREEFDIAVLMLPPSEARETALRLAEAGKHMFIEKHAARTAEELRPVAELARRKGVTIQIGYPWIYHPVAGEIRRLLDQGVLGRLVNLEVRHVTLKVGPGHRDPQQWLYRRATQGGGMLHMEGSHWLSLMRFFAQAEVRSVMALCSNVAGVILDDMEDVSTVALEFTNGIHASLHMGYLLQNVGPRDDASFNLRGTLGSIAWRPTSAPEYTVVSATPAWQSAPVRTAKLELASRPVYAEEWGYQYVAAFIRALLTGSPVPLSVEDGVRLLEITDACYESCRSGRRVEL